MGSHAQTAARARTYIHWLPRIFTFVVVWLHPAWPVRRREKKNTVSGSVILSRFLLLFSPVDGVRMGVRVHLYCMQPFPPAEKYLAPAG